MVDMRKTVLYIFLIMAMTASCSCMFAAPSPASRNNEGVFIRYELSKKDFYCNEGVFMTVWLCAAEGDVAFVEETSPPTVGDTGFSYIAKVANNVRPRKERHGKVDFMAFPVASYIVMMRDSGKFTLDGGRYNIGINVPAIYNDPFGRRIRAVETREIDVLAQSTVFKVKSLPKADNGFVFSGVVGEFSLETVVPPGDIIVNEEATALIRLKGNGLIGNDILPEYREAFGHGTRLKSVSDNCNVYSDGKTLMSEVELQCEFIPESIDDCMIGAVRFGYFNPETSKYETAESEPVKVKVESSVIRRQKIDI